MARYIDANKIHYHQKENIDGYIYSEYVSKDEIDAVPTEDVEPVRRGHWIINSDGYYPQCSECMNEPQGRVMTDWCPNCGAKMGGE